MNPGSAAPPPLDAEGAVFPGEIEVCREFGPRIRAIALRHLKDRSAADDIVQEVLASVVVALRERRIERPDHVGAYVLSACRRRIADVHRTEARRTALRVELDGIGGPDWTQTPPCPERQLDFDRFVRAMWPLSGREREVLTETFTADRSAEEIARCIGTTPAHVRVLRHRAIAKVRAALGWEEGS